VALNLTRAVNCLRVDRNDKIREACTAALAVSGPHRRVGTLAGHFIVSYYMPPERRSDMVIMGGREANPRENPVAIGAAAAQRTEASEGALSARRCAIPGWRPAPAAGDSACERRARNLSKSI
jgi:hypothetical protein